MHAENLKYRSKAPCKDTKVQLKLIKKDEISHNTRLFRFALPSDKHVLGLPVGRHISLVTEIDGKPYMKSYTPVSSDRNKGYVDLIIKIYFPNVHPDFPNGGRMTMHLEKMKIGEYIDVVGPKGFCEYKYRNDTEFNFKIQKDKKFNSPNTPSQKNIKKIGMIAGGSGITPMLAIIREILCVEDDQTEVYLLFANQKEEDILCRDEIEKFQKARPNQVKVFNILSRLSEEEEKAWENDSTNFVGRINQEILEKTMPEVSEDHQILVCGPGGMIKEAVVPNLHKIGWTDDLIHIY